MDYKDKYEKAVQAAMLAKQDTESAVTIGILEEIFPELRESEDERIRKELIKETKGCEVRLFETVTNDEFIAWLEKQGEQPKQDNSAVKDYNSIDPHFCKPIDKVEPKFHEGKWITNGDYTWKIVEVKPLDYILQSQDGNIVDDTISHVDEQFHSFTIEDARESDVLVASDGSIFIFAGVVDYACKHYVALSTDDVVIFNEGLEHCWEMSSAVHPATKEQRDTLMKAMADAGYEWDAENKQLRKIEQKPAELIKEYDFHGMKIVPKFKKGDLIREKLSGRILTIKDFSYDNGLYTYDTGQFPITIQNHYELMEQKSYAWSEEDNQIALSIEQVMNCASLLNIVPEKMDKIRTWLKSLKDRVGNFDDGYKVGFSAAKHNQWKPSDEQMKALKHAFNDCSIAFADMKILETLYEQLKALHRYEQDT